ncbi:DUF262 domain-containing protein [Flavobacterium sp. FlaQc-47]|uniref:GmrSD restriction endonuclease domain-containing protein n=1 Tax=Flavobacterium sp. FlaQc-47 TaxID=3374180 RepID=UPI003756B1D3
MQFTFKQLLEKYNVVIPQLQRDYAQGRKSEGDLRKVFISNIKSVLKDDGTHLNLDFVYGYTELAGNHREVFIPLDGQQRLTTLWLIHWYLSPRFEEIIGDETLWFLDSETAEYLQNFTYQTRISSKRFCSCLISESLNVNGDEKLSEKISDSSWYMASWNNDPTIKSMLTMLDTLQQIIEEKENSWSNLLSGSITFDYIDIKSEEFRLTDELYIKMNSRGKPLTDFENFKALFSGILAGKNTEYVADKKTFQNAEVSYQDYFAFKIDGQWLDLFWSYRKDVYISVDDSILNFLYYVSEFLFYRYDGDDDIYEGILPKRDIDFLAKIFSVKENIDFLFNSLDFLSDLEDVQGFFDALYEHTSTFDNYNKNYFLRCLSNIGFDVKDKTILYAVLAYATKMEVKNVDDEFKDYLRIVRNLLTAVRQPNPKKRIEYISNLRMPNVADYCMFIDSFVEAIAADSDITTYTILSTNEFSGFTKDNIATEITKAEVIKGKPELKPIIHALEEHKQLEGNTVNFNFTQDNTKEKIESFLQIWSSDTDRGLLVRAFLSNGDYSVKTHQRSSIGPVWYFGSKSNWSRVLTASEKDERKKVTGVLDKFLTTYLKSEGGTVNEKLNYIIRQYQSDVRDWRYYFVNYPAITKNGHETLNVFAWGDDNGIEVNQLGNSGKQPLHSYHLNSYEIAVSSIFAGDDRVVLYYGRFTDFSHIKIFGKIRIVSTKVGWWIYWPESINEDEKIFEKYNLNISLNAMLLKENKTQDRIQIAQSFIKDLLDSSLEFLE